MCCSAGLVGAAGWPIRPGRRAFGAAEPERASLSVCPTTHAGAGVASQALLKAEPCACHSCKPTLLLHEQPSLTALPDEVDCGKEGGPLHVLELLLHALQSGNASNARPALVHRAMPAAPIKPGLVNTWT